MPVSLEALLTDVSPDEMRELTLQLATVFGFPATAWQDLSVPRTFVELETRPYADIASLVGKLGQQGFLGTAEGGWLDLVGRGFYATTRQPGAITRGALLLSDDASAGPFTFAPGDVWVTTAGGLRFNNVDGGTLAEGGTLSLTFRAESPGASYNLADLTPLTLVTSLPGVTVQTDTPVGGTWITQQGADVEKDAAYRLRCSARWGELGFGATAAAYLRWALTASTEVTRVGLQESMGDGIVYAYLAGTNGPASSQAVTDVSLYVQPRRPLCVRCGLFSAVTKSIPIGGTAKVKAAFYDSARAKADANIVSLFGKMPIGGAVYRSQIEQAIMNASPGMVDVVLTTNVFTSLLASEVPVPSAAPSAALFWQKVP
jgi:uncharacterized phage protein gp47/JayE